MRNSIWITLILLSFILGAFSFRGSKQEMTGDQVENLQAAKKADCKPFDPKLHIARFDCPCLFSEEILPPPEFDPSLPEQLISNAAGEVFVKWQKIPGAKNYVLYVENEQGRIVRTHRASRNLMFIKDLPIPQGVRSVKYKLRIATQNGKDQIGPKGAGRSLEARALATILAPKVMEIRVEN